MDASKNALGAVLSQIRPDNREHPVAYASHSTSPAEKNYSTTDLESIDYLTKWPEARAIQVANAKTVTEFVHQNLICRHECPKELLSDQETHFVNNMLTELSQ
ncbi:hypothetical protein G9A89_014885 [Geosiphon pyriformis]|nr:hypothetical protein G9A89_014885 [Geosiphon pyriformis]